MAGNLAFQLESIDAYYDSKSRGQVAAEAEPEEVEEDSDIATQVAVEEYPYGEYPDED